MQRYKGEVYVRPHIKSVLNDKNFDEILGRSDEAAWEAFKLVVNNLKCPSTDNWLSLCLQAFVRNGCRMLLKIHLILTCTWKFTSFWNVILHGWVKSNISREMFIQWLCTSLNTWIYSSTIVRKSNLCWVYNQWTLEMSVTRMMWSAARTFVHCGNFTIENGICLCGRNTASSLKEKIQICASEKLNVNVYFLSS